MTNLTAINEARSMFQRSARVSLSPKLCVFISLRDFAVRFSPLPVKEFLLLHLSSTSSSRTKPHEWNECDRHEHLTSCKCLQILCKEEFKDPQLMKTLQCRGHVGGRLFGELSIIIFRSTIAWVQSSIQARTRVTWDSLNGCQTEVKVANANLDKQGQCKQLRRRHQRSCASRTLRMELCWWKACSHDHHQCGACDTKHLMKDLLLLTR